MKVLVTGGRGFIGQHVLAPLLEQGYEVHVVSSRPSISLPHVIMHQGNLLDCETHQALIKQIRPSHLLHAAWYAENGKFWHAIDNVYWLNASLSLVKSFYDQGGERVLGLGTCAEYDWQYGLCVAEQTPELPASLYGKTKKSTFECLQALALAYEKSFAWARIFFPYGPGEAASRLIPHVVTHLLRDEKAECTHGRQIRDFLHVNDMAHALAAILASPVQGVINVGSGVPIRIRELVNQIGSILGRPELIHFGAIPEPAHSPRMILADIDKLKTEVKWKQKISLDEGLLNTIDWWRSRINSLR